MPNGKVKKKGGQKTPVIDCINTVCNIIMALTALGPLAFMV
jgi:hypothetical protein